MVAASSNWSWKANVAAAKHEGETTQKLLLVANVFQAKARQWRESQEHSFRVDVTTHAR